MARPLRPAEPAAPNAPGEPARPGFALGIVKTSRPKQWPKNVLVFAAPGAAGVLTHGHAITHALAAFALFCGVSSGTYFLNDSFDAPADRAHPVKRHRPVAAGVIPVPVALAIGLAMMGAATGLAALVRPELSLILGIYVAVQVGYSLYLKHQPVFDLTFVASGFVLRAIAGAVAIPVPVSEWFLIVTTFGSLLMVTGKRLAEHAELGEGRGSHRRALDQYSTTYLRIVLAVAASGAILGYCLWAFSLQTAQMHHHREIWFQLSIVPIMLALLHYTYLMDKGRGARPEELVFGDRQLQALGLVWLVLFCVGIYR